MPTEWTNALQNAAIQVDAELIYELTQQIPQTHRHLAQGLTDLVNHFCFDEILELIMGDTDV